MNRAELRHWLASGDATTARAARRLVRTAKRLGARMRSGSVHAEMDRIVMQANDPTRGSSLAPDIARRSRRRR